MVLSYRGHSFGDHQSVQTLGILKKCVKDCAGQIVVNRDTYSVTDFWNLAKRKTHSCTILATRDKVWPATSR